jgi:hypothetical protein
MRAWEINPLTGVFVGDLPHFELAEGETLPSNIILTPCPDGFIWPKWDGTKWVEGSV